MIAVFGAVGRVSRLAPFERKTLRHLPDGPEARSYNRNAAIHSPTTPIEKPNDA